MLVGERNKMSILLLLAIGWVAGCSATAPHDIGLTRAPNLLFGSDRPAVLATQIGRSQWPATYGPVESVQDTIFLEYYRDYQGGDFSERYNPRSLFRSYRIGTQQR